jgi:hypothetical protein
MPSKSFAYVSYTRSPYHFPGFGVLMVKPNHVDRIDYLVGVFINTVGRYNLKDYHRLNKFSSKVSRSEKPSVDLIVENIEATLELAHPALYGFKSMSSRVNLLTDWLYLVIMPDIGHLLGRDTVSDIVGRWVLFQDISADKEYRKCG